MIGVGGGVRYVLCTECGVAAILIYILVFRLEKNTSYKKTQDAVTLLYQVLSPLYTVRARNTIRKHFMLDRVEFHTPRIS
jgi:hypothetical protein